MQLHAILVDADGWHVELNFVCSEISVHIFQLHTCKIQFIQVASIPQRAGARLTQKKVASKIPSKSIFSYLNGYISSQKFLFCHRIRYTKFFLKLKNWQKWLDFDPFQEIFNSISWVWNFFFWFCQFYCIVGPETLQLILFEVSKWFWTNIRALKSF